MRKRDEVVLWPVYFDSLRTRAEGRKIPKRLVRQSPTLSMIEKVLINMGLSYTLVPEGSHPYFPWRKTGFVLVKKQKRKNQILKEVASELSRLPV